MIDEAELAEEGRAVSDEAMMDTTVLDSAAAGGMAMEEEAVGAVDEADSAAGVAGVTDSVDERTGAADDSDSVVEAAVAAGLAEDATDETAGRAEDTELVVVGNSFVLECASAGTDMIVNPIPPFGPVPVASCADVPATVLLVASLAAVVVPESAGRLVAAPLVEASAAAPDARVVAALVAANSVVAVAEVAELSAAPCAPHGAVTETVSVMVDTTELTTELSAAARVAQDAVTCTVWVTVEASAVMVTVGACPVAKTVVVRKDS
jgi:hypothetical protein